MSLFSSLFIYIVKVCNSFLTFGKSAAISLTATCILSEQGMKLREIKMPNYTTVIKSQHSAVKCPITVNPCFSGNMSQILELRKSLFPTYSLQKTKWITFVILEFHCRKDVKRNNDKNTISRPTSELN